MYNSIVHRIKKYLTQYENHHLIYLCHVFGQRVCTYIRVLGKTFNYTNFLLPLPPPLKKFYIDAKVLRLVNK